MWHCFLNPKLPQEKKSKLIELVSRGMSNQIVIYELKGFHATQQQLRVLLSKGVDKFMVAGGDGTLNTFINALMPIRTTQDITISPIPLGTGNDWARSLNTPMHLPDAISGAYGKTKKVDIFRCKTDAGTFWGLNSVGCGFDTQVLEKMNAKKHKYFSYLRATMSSLSNRKTIGISTNGSPFHRQIMCLIGKGKFAGQGLKLLPNAELDNGLLSCTLIEPMKSIELYLELPKLLSGNFIKHKKVEHLSLPKFNLRFAAPTRLQIDGDLTPPTRFADIEVRPRQIKVPIY